MTTAAKIAAMLGLILMLAAGGVVATQGPRLAALQTQATEVVWLGPDELARISEAYLRPHLLAHLDRVPTVRWVGWNDRRRTLTEPPRRRAHMRVAAALLGGVLLLGLLRAVWGLLPALWFLLRGVGRLSPGTTAGSARWATGREAVRDLGSRFERLRRLGLLRPEPPFVVGRVGRRAVSLSTKRQGLNILAVGVPGEGKSSAIVIPNLLREGRGGRPRRSLVVADPKGECHAAAAGALSGAGYTVTRLDFYDAKGAGYNPLAHIQTASQALVFARAWIANTRGQGEVGASAEFWDSTVALLLQAAVLHLNHQYRARGAQAAPLARLLALFNVEDFDLLKDELLRSPCPEAADAVRGFLGGIEKNERLGGSILVGLLVKFAVLHDPAVARVTAHDDLDFRAMGNPVTAPLALFVILTPGMEEVLRPLTGCLFMQLFDALVAAANARPGQALGRRVFCYLDEVGTVGVIAGLPRRLATLRSAGVGLLLAVQDTIQLDTLYLPEGRRLITSTCQTHIIFAGVGQEDAAWVSTRLGTATVVGRSASAGRDREDLLVGSGGYNRAEVGRPLMTPEEIQQLPDGYIIVNALHARPVLARTLPWYQARGLRRLVARTAPPPSGGIASFSKQQAVAPTAPDEDDNALAG